MIWRLLFAGLLCAYLLLLAPFTTALARRPVEIKLGYLPHPQVLRATMADQRLLTGEWLVVRVLFYYGTIMEKAMDGVVVVRPEFFNMYKTLQAATQLDPYNMDTYYFAQAAFTWELNRVQEVNDLLEYGLKFRGRDPWLHFYLGFNYAYFLKDYQKAAEHMRRAGELSGNPLFINLAARYFYESEQTSLGLSFLNAMIAGARDPAVKKTYELRRQALLAITVIERALADFKQKNGKAPESLEALVAGGLLDKIPGDPYGGSFYLDPAGKVRTTSKLAARDREAFRQAEAR